MDDRVSELDREISAIARDDPAAKRLQQLRGVGPIIASALVAAVGDARHFANGRQMAASLGLTPAQHSSGGKERLLGISKRGDRYLPLGAHSRRQSRDPDRQEQGRSAQPLGERLGEAPTPQCGGYGFGQQNRAHCLGDAAKRNPLPARSGEGLTPKPAGPIT